MDKRVERCRILQSRQLLCTDEDLFDGWRVTVNQSTDFRYDIRYSITSVSAPGGLSQAVFLGEKTILASEVLEQIEVDSYEAVIPLFHYTCPNFPLFIIQPIERAD